jgi:hypothetical protein
MFLGHWAVGFAAKRVAPAVSLGTLLLAAQFVDLVWPTLLLLGVERVELAPGATRVTPLDFTHYPWTHSLLGAAAWAALVGGAYFSARRRAASAVVLALAVVSHWFLDLVVHRPDLPLVPGGAAHGFGLWSSLPATLAIEAALFAAGVWLYSRVTRPRDRAGRLGLAALVATLAVVYVANVFGPPPPSVAAIAWAGHLQWLFVAWGFWLDRHREARA